MSIKEKKVEFKRRTIRFVIVPIDRYASGRVDKVVDRHRHVGRRLPNFHQILLQNVRLAPKLRRRVRLHSLRARFQFQLIAGQTIDDRIASRELFREER